MVFNFWLFGEMVALFIGNNSHIVMYYVSYHWLKFFFDVLYSFIYVLQFMHYVFMVNTIVLTVYIHFIL